MYLKKCALFISFLFFFSSSQGSGWLVRRPIFMECEIVQCEPLAGSCSLHEVEWKYGEGVTPLSRGTSCTGQADCFYLAVASHFCGKAATRAELDNFLKKWEVTKGEGPMRVENVGKFEDKYPELDLSINIVYQDQKGKIFPIRASKRIHAKNVIVLLLFYVADAECEEELEMDEAVVSHYGLMREPEKILAKRSTSPTTGQMRTSPVFVCWNCFNVMKTRSAYEHHVAFCHQNSTQIVNMPAEGEVRTYEESGLGGKEFQSAFTLFFDFEALQVPAEQVCTCQPEQLKLREELDSMPEEELAEVRMEQEMLEGEAGMRYLGEVALAEGEGRKPRAKGPSRIKKIDACPHKTHIIAEQPPFAYSLVLVDRELKVRAERTYVGEDAAFDFVTSVLDLADKFLPQLSPGEPMIPEEYEYMNSEAVTHCYLCELPFEEEDYRTMDHDHLTGELLGYAHNNCNLRRRERQVLTCFAHNFSGYDSHFIIKALNDYPARIKNIRAIPLNTQKFKYITINNRIRFGDSYAFLTDSLAKLVAGMKKTGYRFPIIQQLLPGEEEREMLMQKGIFPYDFCTSVNKLREQVTLPRREEFANKLTGKDCSEEDYEHAQKVWKFFECEDMLDYAAVYVKSDVYQLADVMMRFRLDVWNTFKLDMCQYVSLPHLGFDCMLKRTGVKIELIADQEMSDLLKKNIRGGLTYVNVRHAVSGPKEGDIVYVDANNLYGKAMTFPLPMNSFRWMSEAELAMFDAMTMITDENGPGYILEVDLLYPSDLHLRHNSFPLAAESVKVNMEDLSEYSKVCLTAIYGKEKHTSTKLSATFKSR